MKERIKRINAAYRGTGFGIYIILAAVTWTMYKIYKVFMKTNFNEINSILNASDIGKLQIVFRYGIYILLGLTIIMAIRMFVLLCMKSPAWDKFNEYMALTEDEV